MASSSSSHQQNRESNAFSGIEPAGKRRKVSESSSLFDVFINHRGPDVKQTLATELYNSLRQLKIVAFLDSEEKELGILFTSTIETAIRSAKVHIAIFSKGYAKSPWCLAELVLMLESGAKIIPVFYAVKPWELRHIEKGVYADAFREYEEKGRYLEKLSEWKEALNKVSFIAGVEFDSSSDCKTIVAAVEKEVQRKRCLYVAKYPVGLNNLVEDFEKRCLDEIVEDFENQCGLEEKKNKPNVVGIFGMGGVGKTTLAKELFNRKRSEYSGASFMYDVREASVRGELPRLQSQLVKDLLNREESFRSIEEGKTYLNDHLQRSPSLNFLIVVDDIDHVEQLDALLIVDILNKLGNSLVIVTTRDVGVVISAGITVGYPLKEMDRNIGRQLFCWHAFDRPCPCAGYEALVEQFVDVCGGLPLSLLVLGRLVHGRGHRFWELKLTKARETLPRDVKQRLRISFDALEDEEKQVFMDVACFFLGKPKYKAERILEGSGWNAQNALQTLQDKCLIEEIHDYMGTVLLRMHDHMRDLGREMALELSPPHRLWRPQDLELMDLQTILAKTNVRCFHSYFDNSRGCRVTFFLGQSDSCVATSASLLCLELEYEDEDEGEDEGEEITEQSMIPSYVPLQNLQYLEISGGRFKTLWENRGQIFPYQRQLSGTDGPLKLRELRIITCPELKELPCPSRLSCLEKIQIGCCDKLQNITLPTSLDSLFVRSCRDLRRLSGTDGPLKLRELRIMECPQIEELPYLSRLSCLEKIRIEDCDKLQNITLPTSLDSLFVSSCRDLQRIIVCPEIEELPCLCISLSVHGCRDLQRRRPELTKQIISDCPELEESPSVSRMSCMKRIDIDCCEKLEKISGIEELCSLQTIRLGHCSNALMRNCIHDLKSVPTEGMVMIGRAVNGAESKLNKVKQSVDSCTPETSPAVIRCFLVVVDSSTKAEDINRSIYWPWPKVREGEWIITIVAKDEMEYNSNYDEVENVFRGEEIIKEELRLQVKKCEEWKSLSVLRIIADRLYQ